LVIGKLTNGSVLAFFVTKRYALEREGLFVLKREHNSEREPELN